MKYTVCFVVFGLCLVMGTCSLLSDADKFGCRSSFRFLRTLGNHHYAGGNWM